MTDDRMTAADWRREVGLPVAGADRERPVRAAPVQHELALQIASADWLRELVWPDGGRPVWSHPANERADKAGAVLAWRCGTRSGTPDWIFWLPEGRTLSIELKVNAYPSKEQKAFRDELEAIGHPWALCRSIEDMAAAMRGVQLNWIETPKATAIRRALS